MRAKATEKITNTSRTSIKVGIKIRGGSIIARDSTNMKREATTTDSRETEITEVITSKVATRTTTAMAREITTIAQVLKQNKRAAVG